jgi:predicted transcriptional regulator
MAKLRFNLISTIPAEDEQEERIKEYHAYWRRTNSNSNAPFVPIFNSFKDAHLATLEPGALRLYLFFALAANNQYGNSWHSIESIAKFFNTQTRTVNNWIKVLVDKNLIYREQNGKRTHTTYLIPYSNTIIRHQLKKNFKEDDQSVLDMFINKVKGYDFLYGSIIGVFHFFQWKTDSKKKPIKEGNHWLFIITKRPDGVLIGHNYPLKNSSDLGVSELIIEDSDIATFISPYQYEGHNIRGLVLKHDIRLTDSNTGVVLQLTEDLAKAEAWNWDEHPKFEYGKIADLFLIEEITEQEEDAAVEEGTE